jgi:HEAT repeat protein
MKTGIDVLKFKAWLSGADPHHRLTALNVFWHSGQVDEEALAMTAQILQTDDEVGIRRDAVRMLRGRKDPRFIPNFVSALDDNDYIVRGEALLALKAMDAQWKDNVRVVKLVGEEVHPFVRACIETL